VLIEQLPEAATDLLAWLKPLQSDNLFVLDGTGVEGTALEDAAKQLGLDYLRSSGRLDAMDQQSAVLVRNLTVRRGQGVVIVEGDHTSVGFAADFIEAAREAGYSLRFPVEVARQHGGAASP
jgi:polysaccharide deacetylase 2 family uncharacterized protein YibQ